MTGKNSYALVADIGGTNTRVALAEGAKLVTSTVTRYSNADHPNLETVLRHFLDQQGGVDCAGACVALAGPVADGRGQLTNLDWEIDEATLAQACKAEHVKLLNDLQAQGHALGHLAEGTVATLLSGTGDADAAKLVIGVGTGFNIAPVFDGPAGRVVPAAEAGHAGLPMSNAEELGFAAQFSAEHGVPAIEDMLSGRGLENVYRWRAIEAGQPSDKSAADIVAGLEEGSDPLCQETAERFAQMLGRVAGNLALIQLPRPIF